MGKWRFRYSQPIKTKLSDGYGGNPWQWRRNLGMITVKLEATWDMSVYMSHGGAFAAAYGARMDHAFGARPDCREHIDELPSTYLKRFYVDTIVFSTDQLEYLVSKFGADHVAIGTDYAADMGEYRPVEHVYQAEGFSESDREKICGLNALKLMNLDESQFKR